MVANYTYYLMLTGRGGKHFPFYVFCCGVIGNRTFTNGEQRLKVLVAPTVTDLISSVAYLKADGSLGVFFVTTFLNS